MERITLAVVSGRPDNDTILTREEKSIWKELCRILKKDLEHPMFRKFHFNIPVYTKFDLEVLRCVEELGLSATLYVPDENWGLSRLPIHQRKLIERTNFPKKIVPNDRIGQMIKESQAVYLLDNTKGVERFKSQIGNRLLIPFPSNRMRYTNEQEYINYNNRMLMIT